jgi:lipopolysaccharide assembly protein A
MQFLKTLFWVALAVVLVLFARANWVAVQLKLWGGLEADIKLPVLVFAAFLVGFLPTLILYRARLWSLRRRFETQERNLAALQGVAMAPANVDEHTGTEPIDHKTIARGTVSPAS